MVDVVAVTFTEKAAGELKGAPWKFPKCGKSGVEVSEIFPQLGKCVDDMAIVRSLCADSAAHGSASIQMNTGFIRQGFPCLGSWALYGLGTANQNMPGFISLRPGGGLPPGGCKTGRRLFCRSSRAVINRSRTSESAGGVADALSRGRSRSTRAGRASR
jgi:hypothetical protein